MLYYEIILTLNNKNNGKNSLKYYKNTIINASKIGIIYFIILLLFYIIHSYLLRVTVSILLYLI